MMRVLTDDEAFLLMNENFKKLSRSDVLDLYYKNKHFAAIVTHVDKANKFFFAIPLTRDNIGRIIRGKETTELITVQLPARPQDQRPCWNVLPSEGDPCA